MLAFVTRARAATRLHDPQLVEVHDFVEQAGKWFAVTEPLFGETLRSRARRSPMKILAAAAIITQAAEALGVIRRSKRGHGAVTIRSILLVERDGVPDHVKVLDFGAGAREDALVPNKALAPERKTGAPPDARCDVWGLASVLFELLEGRPVAEAGELTGASRTGEPIPPLLNDLIIRALEEDPRARHSSVESFSASLQHAVGLAPRPQSSKASHDSLAAVVSAERPVAPAPSAPRAPAAVEGEASLELPKSRKELLAAGIFGLALLAAVIVWLVMLPAQALVPEEAVADPMPRVEPATEPEPLAPLGAVAPNLATGGEDLTAGSVRGAPTKLPVKPVKKPPVVKKKKR